MKAKLVKESLNENNIPNFNTGWDIIEYFDSISEFKPYRNEDARYDDTYYEIPVSVFEKVLGWSKEEIEDIDWNLESYEGSIDYTDKESGEYLPVEQHMIVVTGGA